MAYDFQYRNIYSNCCPISRNHRDFLGPSFDFKNRKIFMKLVLVIACIVWESIYLYSASKRFLSDKPRKEVPLIYPSVTFKKQILIIGVVAELINSGIHPVNSINAGIKMLEEEKRLKYQDINQQLSNSQIDYLFISIRFINQSSISGSKIYETLKLNIETYQRSYRTEVLKSIKKLEVWMLGPLGLCFLPTFMLIAVVPLIGSLITGFTS